MEDRKLYMEKINTQLEDTKKWIATMRDNAMKADANLKHDYLREVEVLEGKLSGMKEKYVQLESSPDSTWESVKQGTETAWNSLKEAVEKAAKHLDIGDTGHGGEHARTDRGTRRFD